MPSRTLIHVVGIIEGQAFGQFRLQAALFQITVDHPAGRRDVARDAGHDVGNRLRTGRRKRQDAIEEYLAAAQALQLEADTALLVAARRRQHKAHRIGPDVLLIGKIAIDQVQRIEAGERRLELGSDTLRRLIVVFGQHADGRQRFPRRPIWDGRGLHRRFLHGGIGGRQRGYVPDGLIGDQDEQDGDESQPTPQQADLADADARLQQRRFVQEVDRIAYDCVGHSGRGVGVILRRPVGRHFLIGRHIAAARDDQANRIVPAFRRIILGKQLAQPPGLHAHHRIGRGIEFGIPAKDVDRDCIALKALGLAHLLPFNEVSEQLARAFGSFERLA